MAEGLPAAGPVAALDLDPARGDGVIRRLDPRARVVAAVLFALVVVALDDLVALSAAVLAAAAMMGLAQLPPRRTLKRMAAMDGFIVVMLILLPFTVPGDPMVTVWGFAASWQGLAEAARIALTANAVVLALMALAGSMEAVVLGHALHRLRVPENLIHLMMFSVRYITVLHAEYRRLRIAMKARGFRPANTRHTYVTLGYLVGMMLVRALERSERIQQAMKCRGFTGRLALLDRFRLAPRDLAFAVAMGALAGGLVALETLHVAAY